MGGSRNSTGDLIKDAFSAVGLNSRFHFDWPMGSQNWNQSSLIHLKGDDIKNGVEELLGIGGDIVNLPAIFTIFSAIALLT